MKAIINGKVYDTDTAKHVGSYSYSYPSDLHYFSENLYCKKTGEFFLYGEGGPASKYCEYIAENRQKSGSRITPLSIEKAKEWVEQYCSTDTYIELFGPAEE